MAVRIKSITVDCTDPLALAAFWSEVTGFREDPDDPNVLGDAEALLVATDGSPDLLFIAVPEAKSVKNRLHLDLVPSGRRREAEVDRLLALGATLVDDLRHADGTGWAVLADPEGNEFCVLRSTAERAAVTDGRADPE